jgi:hypothetical protein
MAQRANLIKLIGSIKYPKSPQRLQSDYDLNNYSNGSSMINKDIEELKVEQAHSVQNSGKLEMSDIKIEMNSNEPEGSV